MTQRRAGLRLAILTAFAVLLGTPVAYAGHRQVSIVEDDARMVLGSDATREQALDDVVVLGADTVRAVVAWSRVAPSPTAHQRPAGFNGAEPYAYPSSYWDRYDGLVRGAAARGLNVLLSPASPIPYWASDCPSSAASTHNCRPDPTQFKRFVQALGRRYSGSYADENQGGGILPRVTMWSVWNEPNQGGWLQPQYASVRGKVVPRSPVIYRSLVRAAIRGLQASGHGRDDILLGETAPLGRQTGDPRVRSIAPGAFLRAVLCLGADGKPLKGPAAAEIACANFGFLPVTGFSHHPYTRGGSQPPTSKGNADEITISSGARLRTIIRQAADHHRVPPSLPVYYTEFGFQTNPPDSVFGVSLANQARWINQSDWLAYNDSRVRSVAQYQLYDEPTLAGFQTGLRFLDGTEKPSYAAYRLPIWVSRTATGLNVWGQLRPASDHALETIDIQNAPDGGVFSTVAQAVTTNTKGFINVRIPSMPGRWRLSWTPAKGGPAITSRVAKVGG